MKEQFSLTPSTTVAMKVGSKFMGIDWRVTQLDMDNGCVVPVDKEGVAWIPVAAAAAAFGAPAEAVAGAVEENGVLMAPLSAVAESLGLFGKYYPDAPYAEGVILLSNAATFTADAAEAEAINPVTTHAAAQLLARVRETRQYVSIELPKAIFDLANPGPDKGMTQRDMAVFASAGTNLDLFPIPAEAEEKEGVPAGKLTHFHMDDCKAYPGVQHDFWTFVPGDCDPAAPANLLVLTDGAAYISFNGKRGRTFDMCTVINNMVHEGQIPPTVILFTQSGNIGDGFPIWGGNDHRSVEYDSVDERFANFLADEVIPLGFADQALNPDPKARATVGTSSGGPAALGAAWNRVDTFGTVIVSCASFAMMRMAGLYQYAVRNQKKDIQVVLMGGENDHTTTPWGHWPTVTQMMADSLVHNEYKHLYAMTKGGHSGEWLARMLPEILRCVWAGKDFSYPDTKILSRNGL